MSVKKPITALCFTLCIPAFGYSQQAVDYTSQIKPILQTRCYACHGGLKQESGLRLDTAEFVRRGGDGGAAITPGQPGQSLLIERVAAKDVSERMPPEGEPLTAEQVALFKRWIEQGAAGPRNEQPQPDPRAHWAFQTPRRRSVPRVTWQSGRPGERIRNPLDAFIAEQHRDQAVIPAGRGASHVLLRRATLDVTGLPPTPSELEEFLKDDSPQSWEKVVDRLLHDPAYGERWGRHWMDVWRYSDWYGRRQVNDVRNSYPHIWRWRDWIINSLNKDTGYDQMLRMMLAADELDPENDENIAALGFIVRNWFSLNYDQWMKDQVEHTSKAFLGLRLHCAHCHDHKYDPITQEEYFRFRAFFEPLEFRHDRVPGGPPLTKYKRYTPGSGASLQPIAAGLPRVFDFNLKAETFMYRLGDARDRFERPPVPPGVPAILNGDRLHVEPIDLPPRAWYPGLKDFVRDEELAKRESALQAATTRLESARSDLRKSQPQLLAAVKLSDHSLAAVKQRLASRQQLSQALAGEQSLVLEGATGRSVLLNQLPGVKQIDDDSRLRFLMRLQTNTYAALGLTLDPDTGSTGGYIAFRNGQIVSYRAGAQHAEFTAGTYDFAQGQHTFEVTFDLQPSRDQFLLSVVALAENRHGTTSRTTRTVLIDQTPAALHGWNIGKSPQHMLSIDARAGAVVVFDDFELGPAQGAPLLRVDFEHPMYSDGSAATGQQGWVSTKWTVAPGTSRVSRLMEAPPELKQAELQNRLVHRALDAPRLTVEAAELRVTAAKSELAALRARTDSDRRRYLAEPQTNEVTELIHSAVRAERTALLAIAQAAHVEAQAHLAQAEAKPLDDSKRGQAIQDASQKLTQAAKVLAARQSLVSKIDDSATYTALSPTYPRQSTGRRAALARWLTDPQNPLPARVAVNHIWMRHFGQPLVDSVFDFGNSGAAPTHPKLLDWLAVEFIESGWSMKHIHRLILTSQTYQMSSRLDKSRATTGTSPRSGLVWRFRPRRLEAESIRDCMLHVSGRLDRTLGGQEIDPKQEATSRRRSLYFSVYPEAGGTMQFLEQFDAADPSDCYRRTESIVPQQALAMNNSQIVQDASRNAATRLLTDLGKVPDRRERLVQLAFVACLSRECSEMERRLAIEFLDRQSNLHSDQVPLPEVEQRALASLIRVLFSHSDFVTLR